MKHRAPYISTFIFFILIQTAFLWEGELFIPDMLLFLMLMLYFMVLCVVAFVQLFKAIREGFQDKTRNMLLCMMTLVLMLTALYPMGMVNVDLWRGKPLLVANREGAANCMTTLKLWESGVFNEVTVCFGVSKKSGTYQCSGDTIYMKWDAKDASEYQYGIVISKGKILNAQEEIWLFNDTLQTPVQLLGVVVNNLKARQQK